MRAALHPHSCPGCSLVRARRRALTREHLLTPVARPNKEAGQPAFHRKRLFQQELGLSSPWRSSLVRARRRALTRPNRARHNNKFGGGGSRMRRRRVLLAGALIALALGVGLIAFL